MASLEAPFPLSPCRNPSTVTNPIDVTSPIEHSNLNMDASSVPEPKKKQGRIKIAIERIQNKNRKHVTFSKRRKGLFKKATELCVLCDASVAIITFSEAGKAFTFGHPTTDAVIHRFLHGAPSSTPASIEHTGAPIGNPLEPVWWDRPVEELGFEELESFAASLKQIRSNVERRITDLDLDQLKLNAAAVKTDFDYDYYDHLPIPIHQVNSNYNFNGVSGDFFALPPPVGQNQDVHQYQCCGCGCMGDDISGIIAMAKFNKSANLGFGEY